MAAGYRLTHAERKAIGAAIRDPGAAAGCGLRGADFTHPAAIRLWEGMLALGERGIVWAGELDLAARLATDEEDLERRLVAYLDDPVIAGAEARDLETYSEVVREASTSRQVIATCAQATELLARGYEGGELLAELQARLARLGATNTRLASRGGGELAAALIDLVETRRDAGPATYVPFGLARLDAAVGGWQRGVLNLIIGRTGHGKSASVLQFALEAAAHLPGRRPVHILSAEDVIADTGWRLLSRVTGIPARELRRYEALDDVARARVSAARDELAAVDRIRITPVPGLSARQLVATVRRYQEADGTGIVFYDYLQKLPKRDSDGALLKENDLYTEALDVFDTASKLDGFAWVIASQSNRGESDGVPTLRNMRGSGAIEQNAKLAIAIHRPRAGRADDDDEILVRVLKASNDQLCDCPCVWDGPRMRILDERPPPRDNDGPPPPADDPGLPW